MEHSSPSQVAQPMDPQGYAAKQLLLLLNVLHASCFSLTVTVARVCVVLPITALAHAMPADMWHTVIKFQANGMCMPAWLVLCVPCAQ